MYLLNNTYIWVGIYLIGKIKLYITIRYLPWDAGVIMLSFPILSLKLPR